MKLRIKDGCIWNEDGIMIAVLTTNCTVVEERTISLGSEIITVAENFIKEVNSGSFKPKLTVKKFQKIIDKYE